MAPRAIITVMRPQAAQARPFLALVSVLHFIAGLQLTMYRSASGWEIWPELVSVRKDIETKEPVSDWGLKSLTLL